MHQNKFIVTALLLVITAGASMQVVYWNQARGAGGRGIGQAVTTIALILLARFAPRYSRALSSSRTDWRFNLLLGLIAIALLGALTWFVYARYYGPLIQTMNSADNV